jgi:hypothetical protein
MRLVVVPAALSLILLAGLAHAQHDPAAAESLFRDAKAAEARGDYKTACGQFAESQRLDPGAGTLLNEADCEEHLGALATAWGHFTEAKEELPKGDDRLPFATQRIAALEKRVPHLVVRLPAGAPAGTRVLRGSIEIGAAAFSVPFAVDPGPLTLTVIAPGGAQSTKSVNVVEGQTSDVTVDVPSAPAAPPPVAPTPAPAPAAAPANPASPPESSGGTLRTVGWIVGGVGVAGLALGAVTGIIAMGDASTFKSNCNNSTGACSNQTGVNAANDGKTMSTLSTVGFIAGAVVTGVGVYFIVTGGPSSPSTTVGAAALPGGAGITLARGF